MSSRLNIAIKLVLAAVILFFIFQRIPLWEGMAVISASNPLYFALAVGVHYLQRIVMGYRSRLLAWQQGLDGSTSQLVSVGLIAALSGLFLPGTLAGGGVRWYKLNKIVSMPSEILVLIVFDRMIVTVFMVALGLIFFLLDDALGTQGGLGIELAIACGALFAIYVLAFNGRVVRFALPVLLALEFLPDFVTQNLRKLFDAAIRFSELSFLSHLKLLFLSLVICLVGVLAFFFLARGLSVPLGFDTIAWINSAVTALVMLPITFAGLGVGEAGMVVMLEPLGVDSATALAFALLIFCSTVALSQGGGLLELKQQYFGINKRKATNARVDYTASDQSIHERLKALLWGPLAK